MVALDEISNESLFVNLVPLYLTGRQIQMYDHTTLSI